MFYITFRAGAVGARATSRYDSGSTKMMRLLAALAPQHYSLVLQKYFGDLEHCSKTMRFRRTAAKSWDPVALQQNPWGSAELQLNRGDLEHCSKTKGLHRTAAKPRASMSP
jgi:hypothetical protein